MCDGQSAAVPRPARLHDLPGPLGHCCQGTLIIQGPYHDPWGRCNMENISRLWWPCCLFLNWNSCIGKPLAYAIQQCCCRWSPVHHSTTGPLVVMGTTYPVSHCACIEIITIRAAHPHSIIYRGSDIVTDVLPWSHLLYRPPSVVTSALAWGWRHSALRHRPRIALGLAAYGAGRRLSFTVGCGSAAMRLRPAPRLRQRVFVSIRMSDKNTHTQLWQPNFTDTHVRIYEMKS